MKWVDRIVILDQLTLKELEMQSGMFVLMKRFIQASHHFNDKSCLLSTFPHCRFGWRFAIVNLTAGKLSIPSQRHARRTHTDEHLTISDEDSDSDFSERRIRQSKQATNNQ